jgi:hypothetical protein
MEKILKKNIILIFIVSQFSISLLCAEEGKIKFDNKSILFDDQIYFCSKDENSDKGLNIYKVKANDHDSIERYFLCAEVDTKYQKYPIRWDVSSSAAYLIYIEEGMAYSDQRINLIKMPFERFKLFEGNNLDIKDRVFHYGMREFERLYGIDPLSISLPQSNPRLRGQLYYDFFIQEVDSMILFMSWSKKKETTVWQFKNNNWQKIAVFQFSIPGPFRIIRNDGEVSVLTDTGELFRLKDFDIEKQSESMLAELRKPEKVDEDKLESMRNSVDVVLERIEMEDNQPILNFVIDRSRNTVGLLTRQKAFDLSGGKLKERVKPAPKTKGVKQQTVGIDKATAAQIPASVRDDETFQRVLDYVSTLPVQAE